MPIELIFFLFFVFVLMSFCWSSCCQYCFSRMLSVLSEHFYVVIESLYRCINDVYNDDVIFLLYFLIQSTSSLGCNALCIVIRLLVLWSICVSSSLVHFKNGPDFLTRVTAQIFIPLIRFLLHSFVFSSFLVVLRYSFLFYFISTCLMVPAVNIPKYL